MSSIRNKEENDETENCKEGERMRETTRVVF
jgi:hypothetical protein